MRLTKKDIEKKYNCVLEKDSGFDDSHKFWRALPKDYETELYAEGWTLAEIYLKDSYGAGDTWDACMKLSNHICENYTIKKENKKCPHYRMASTVKDNITEDMKQCMTELCEKAVELRNRFIDGGLND